MAAKSYNRSKYWEEYITTNFKFKEHACKDGVSNILVDKKLYEMINKLRTQFPKTFKQYKVGRITVNSGHRTSSWDKKVGGSGKGMHTKGTAADIVVYDVNGKIIPAKYVCCVASVVGFKGIGYISSKNTATHVDIRTGSKWWGDERYNNKSIGSSWFTYFGIKKNPPTTYKKKTVNVKKGSSLIVRKGPSKKYGVDSKLARGKVVTIYKAVGKWAKIDKNKERYVHTDFLK